MSLRGRVAKKTIEIIGTTIGVVMVFVLVPFLFVCETLERWSNE